MTAAKEQAGPEPARPLLHPALAGFHAPLSAWFASSFAAPTRAQTLAWPLLVAGETTLILAPTGSGKTLAAFLAAIDRLLFEPVPPKEQRCRVLYISPLKALAIDVERNLRAPLVGVARYAERMGHPFHLPEVAVRTGDTSQKERALFQRHPADILITTPESLYLLLTTEARAALRSVRSVILDEVHALLPTKRGAHLALSLERLEEIVNISTGLQRVGLSATVQPVDEAARYLGGFCSSRARIQGDDPGEIGHVQRRVSVADARAGKTLDLRVEVPVEDMAKLGQLIREAPQVPRLIDDREAPQASRLLDEIPSGPASRGEGRTSIWPAMHPLILSLIRAHRSTLIFVNSRRLAERLAAALNELAGAVPGTEVVRAHHGSIAREQRMQIEDQLKAGVLPALVATSSLELGIDMGAIDLVIQVEAPPSVASGIQRIGRAGHHIGVPSKGVILPKFRGDLLACAALSERMQAGAVEPQRYPRNALDVLSQQIVAMVAMDEWKVDDLWHAVRRAAPFAELPRSALDGVLDMLSGRYPSDEFAGLRPRLTWDRLQNTLKTREGARRLAVISGGAIPDRGLYGVFLVGGASGERGGKRGASARVGELDEEMVFESRVGETFLLGASTWRIEEITHDRVLVSPAPGEPGKMPFWHGDRAGRPLEFGRAIGALSRTLRALPAEDALRLLTEKHALSPGAAENLLRYLSDQQAATDVLPDDRTLVVERYRDEMGDFRVCLLSPFGSQVHGPWAIAIEAMVRERSDLDIDVLWTDDGIVARFPEASAPPDLAAVLPDPDEVEDLVARQIGKSALFASRFREAAVRALLLPRKLPGQRTALWQQRRRSADLLKAASRFDTFPIVLETYRECLRDVFDLPALVQLLRDVRRRHIRAVVVDSDRPSPFASALLFNYVANFIYEGDTPLQERRAQALMVDPGQLRELLGEVELRELLSAEALAVLELRLQHLADERKARHKDGLHDLLLGLGDLSAMEVLARASVPAAEAQGWLDQLVRERRAVILPVAGEPRYVAAEDTGRYRDAIGIPPPAGLPAAFLEFVRDPLGDLVARHARTHGPFHAAEVASRLGIGAAPVTAALSALLASGKVVKGAFRPGGTGYEYCDAEVLRALRQKSLSRLRHEVEPVEQPTLGRLYLAWQGIGGKRHGADAILEVVEQIQGAQVPASVLESQVIPERLSRYDPGQMDQLSASGNVIWVGHEPLGEHDGRVSLYLMEHAALLLPDLAKEADRPDGPLHRQIREHLSTRGASFYPQLVAACQAMSAEVLDALWDLVWSSEVTNDTLQPLRARLLQAGSPKRHRSSHRASYHGPVRARGLARNLMPPDATGRWALVRSFVQDRPSPTERLTARARQMLARHGVLTREAVAAEGIEGGFSAIYPVLKGMEEAGQVRRGYFVAGLGATQFALPGAVDRLRTLREPEQEAPAAAVLLAATDPANPYGAALPWPERPKLDGKQEGRRPGRSAGAVVALVDGALAAWMGRGERHLVTFFDQVKERAPGDVALVLARALAEQVASGKRRGHGMIIREIDGVPARESPVAQALVAAGFQAGSEGYVKRPFA